MVKSIQPQHKDNFCFEKFYFVHKEQLTDLLWFYLRNFWTGFKALVQFCNIIFSCDDFQLVCKEMFSMTDTLKHLLSHSFSSAPPPTLPCLSPALLPAWQFFKMTRFTTTDYSYLMLLFQLILTITLHASFIFGQEPKCPDWPL